MKKYILITLGIFLVAIDQLIKWWIIKYYPSLVTENSGILFGFIENQAVSLILLLVGLLILIWLIYTRRDKVYSFYLLLISAGAISNVIDRIAHNSIIDYIKIPGSWFTFNFADIYIGIGVVLYVIETLKEK